MARSSFDLKVFISTSDSVCDECGEHLGRRAWITLVEGKGALCLNCADLDHLLFLPAGDAALTRRSRKRYERQGMLVEAQALERAEQECLEDSEARARRRERETERRELLDDQYVERFARRVRELYPGCPQGREVVIAEHACLKYSGRVGRSAAAKDLDEDAVRLAVVAHIRHAETGYDELLAQGIDRWEARAEVDHVVAQVLAQWRAPGDRQI